jgi:hypothetical protein
VATYNGKLEHWVLVQMLEVETCRGKLALGVHVQLVAVHTCRLEAVLHCVEACCTHWVFLVQRLATWP